MNKLQWFDPKFLLPAKSNPYDSVYVLTWDEVSNDYVVGYFHYSSKLWHSAETDEEIQPDLWAYIPAAKAAAKSDGPIIDEKVSEGCIDY